MFYVNKKCIKDIPVDDSVWETERKNDMEKTEADWGWPQARTGFHQTRGFLHTHERIKNPGSGDGGAAVGLS